MVPHPASPGDVLRCELYSLSADVSAVVIDRSGCVDPILAEDLAGVVNLPSGRAQEALAATPLAVEPPAPAVEPPMPAMVPLVPAVEPAVAAVVPAAEQIVYEEVD